MSIGWKDAKPRSGVEPCPARISVAELRPGSDRRTWKETLTAAGRAGFVARGAFGQSGRQADRQGALHRVAAQPFGHAMLWALVVGFGRMATWRAGRSSAPPSAAGSGGSSSGNAQSQDWTASA